MKRKEIRPLLGGAAVLALLLTGCSGEDTAGEDTAGSADSMTYVGYGGVVQDAAYEQWLQPFAEATGAEVLQDSPLDFAKLTSMVESGRTVWDLINSEPFFPIQECGDLVQELQLENVDVGKLPEGTVYDCTVPIYGYAVMLAYNADTYGDEPPASYADFFDLERFPGTRLAPASAVSGPLEVALLADGVDPDELYPLDIDRALAKWDTIRGNVNFWQTGAESQQALESGSADMAIVWSGRIAEAELNGANVEPVWAQNLFAWAALSVPTGAPGAELAFKAIEDVLTPETQERLAESMAYSPVNSDARPDLNPTYAKLNVASPEAEAQRVTQDAQWIADNQQELVEAWSNWMLG